MSNNIKYSSSLSAKKRPGKDYDETDEQDQGTPSQKR